MMTYFSLNLKHYRKVRNMSQDELALKSGLSQQYISVIESINRSESPTLASIVKLSQALNICPYALLQYNCEEHCNNYNSCTITKKIHNTNYITEYGA